MNHLFIKTTLLGTALLYLMFITSCNKDNETPDQPPQETGKSKAFTLFSAETKQAGGTVTFKEMDDNSTKVVISLNGLSGTGTHPAHIHDNSGAKGGNIAISLTAVDAANGTSETIITKKDDGTAITYDDLIAFNGHVNIHKSNTELNILIAQGDIGPNELTTNFEDYDLMEMNGSGIQGDITFIERISGEILAVLFLENTSQGESHPAHVHMNSLAIGGGIAISFNPVDGNSGVSLTDFSQLDDGTPITFSELKDFEGHVKVHLSADNLSIVVAAGDIGGNELTGNMVDYPLGSVTDPGISGTATFKERKSGKTLVAISLQNTPAGGSHPSHIHMNSAVEGGTVIVPLNNVNGDTGMGYTDVGADKDGNELTYENLIAYDGHINVHKSDGELGTVIARGDIGGNALTGDKTSYNLMEMNASGISGNVTFEKRNNGFTLVTLMLTGTMDGKTHPAHIHENSLSMGGGIVIDLEPVDGGSGMSKKHVEKKNNGDAITYDELVNFNGHVKVHESPDNLATLVAAGDIGSNTP